MVKNIDKLLEYISRRELELHKILERIEQCLREQREKQGLTKIFYTCDECGDPVEALTLHINDHHSNPIFSLQCPKCKKYTIYNTDTRRMSVDTTPY